jgi:hypothetical protein
MQIDIRKIIKEELAKALREEEMAGGGSGSPSKKLSRAAINHLENTIKIENDPYDEATPGHTIEGAASGESISKAFIASEEPPTDFENDDQMYRHGELGSVELWVGTYRKEPKVFSKTGESLDGYFVCEYTGMGWHYVAGPFSSEEEAKQKGVEIAKEKGMKTYKEIESSGSDEDMLKEFIKKALRTKILSKKRSR